jgi:hypothetical protein
VPNLPGLQTPHYPRTGHRQFAPPPSHCRRKWVARARGLDSDSPIPWVCWLEPLSPVRRLESSVSIDRQLNTTTASALPSDGCRRQQVVQLLQTRGADQIAHLNGTLFEHLERTELLLRSWACSETVSLAGLSHAVYGTDGFPTALLTLEERTVLREVAGPDVEALVYLYASCDRAFVYPRLSSGPMDFRDRFTGLTFLPAGGELRDLVDLTLANESDVGLVGTGSDEAPEWLHTMFSLFQHLASASVRDGFDRLTSASG